MKQQDSDNHLEVMKVMNYTGFMNKLPYLLFPKRLEQLYPELEGLEHASRVRRETGLIEGCVANVDPLRIMKSEFRIGSRKLIGSPLCAATPQVDANWSKALEAGSSAGWTALLRQYAESGLRLGSYAPAMSIIGDIFALETESDGEHDEVAELRHEVEELKQQVAVLTGLVNLRVEPARDPLAAAKSRGASYMKNELANPDSLSLADASKYTGRADRLINVERNKGWLYALVLEGNTRGFRYPKWQFDVPASRLRTILDVLAPGSLSCWSLHNFLTRPHSDLDGKSPAAAIADGDFPIERIIEVARRRIDQHQGAA